MLSIWLAPLLAWLGIDLLTLLLIVLIIVVFIRG